MVIVAEVYHLDIPMEMIGVQISRSGASRSDHSRISTTLNSKFTKCSISGFS
jgi:hypothetical protein